MIGDTFSGADAGTVCGPSASALDNHTALVSAGLEGVITDPLVGDVSGASFAAPAAWGSNTDGEVPDPCRLAGDQATFTAAGRTWTVYEAWSNIDNACATSQSWVTPTAAFTSGTPQDAAVTFDAGSSSSVNTPAHSAVVTGSSDPFVAPGIFSYVWDFGDGSPSGSGAQPVHLYGVPGMYTVTLRVTDEIGLQATVSHQVTIPAVPTCSATAASTPAGGGIVPVSLSCSGPTGVPLTYAIVTAPAHGKLGSIDQATGVVSYTSNALYSGSDSFAYRASDPGGSSSTVRRTEGSVGRSRGFSLSLSLSLSL